VLNQRVVHHHEAGIGGNGGLVRYVPVSLLVVLYLTEPPEVSIALEGCAQPDVHGFKGDPLSQNSAAEDQHIGVIMLPG